MGEGKRVELLPEQREELQRPCLETREDVPVEDVNEAKEKMNVEEQETNEEEVVGQEPVRSCVMEEKKKEIRIQPGCTVTCLWREDQRVKCEIVDIRRKPGTDVMEYYVHYDGFNRRLDEWVEKERFDMKTLKARVLTREEKERVRKRDGKKRKSATEDMKEEKAEKESERDEATKVKNIQTIILGKWAINSWYYSPFPKEFSSYSTLRICDFCLQFFRSEGGIARHMKRCPLRHPPGDEIYRKDNIAMFEVDGARSKMYCQNLCYIAKLFLDHKTLYYDVDPFWFYIMCEIDETGYHVVGYFSKEKASEENYNVACILTLPPYQRKGYGKFLMAFSYELSKIEGKHGSPEKPLSDLGLLGYRSYWSQVLIDLLRKEETPSLSIQEIADITMMQTEDVISTLTVLNLIQYYEGQHIIDLRRVSNLKMGSRGLPVDPSQIRWTPKLVPGAALTLRITSSLPEDPLKIARLNPT